MTRYKIKQLFPWIYIGVVFRTTRRRMTKKNRKSIIYFGIVWQFYLKWRKNDTVYLMASKIIFSNKLRNFSWWNNSKAEKKQLTKILCRVQWTVLLNLRLCIFHCHSFCLLHGLSAYWRYWRIRMMVNLLRVISISRVCVAQTIIDFQNRLFYTNK